MPLYEFECTRCRRRFEELVRGAGDLQALKCPDCGSEDVARQISAACVGTAGSGGTGGYDAGSASAGGSCCGGGSCCH